MKACPCGSGRSYDECCEPYIKGKKPVPTAEALMRSRYAAYAEHEIDYILETCSEGERKKIDIKQTKAWSENSKWLGLKIISAEKGGAKDSEGIVEFEASYEMDGLREVHREKASFKQTNGRWFYTKGEVRPDTVVRVGPKIGRNEPCPCGSGKKYKHCCAMEVSNK